MCLTTGKKVIANVLNVIHTPHLTDVDSGQHIFSKMDEVITTNGILWSHCIGVGVDNTSVNLGVQNSIRTRVLQCNPNTYFMGCPCHIVHNTALKASETFAKKSYNFNFIASLKCFGFSVPCLTSKICLLPTFLL